MITPYSSSLAHIELPRVRRVDPALSADDSRFSLPHDPGDVALSSPPRSDRVEISDEARRLLDEEMSVHTR